MVYELDITLEDIEPAIWRRIQVPAEITLAELHHVIQIAMGWTDAHLHQYLVGGEVIGIPDADAAAEATGGTPLTDETTVRLVDVALANTTLRYEYDFGDRWQHRIVVSRVLPHDVEAPVCVDGARGCPPEDCGGAGVWRGNVLRRTSSALTRSRSNASGSRSPSTAARRAAWSTWDGSARTSSSSP